MKCSTIRWEIDLFGVVSGIVEEISPPLLVPRLRVEMTDITRVYLYMHWADKLADQIIKSGKYKPYWVDDMKTTSGRVHIGSVRAFLSHAFVYLALKDKREEATFSYVFEDHDPFDKIPSYIDKEKYEKYLGMPLYKVPALDPKYDNYGQMWAKEYEQIFDYLKIEVKIIWGSELYSSGKMNAVLRECLDKAEEIRKIYWEMYEQEKGDDWYPVTMVCEQCGKLSTTEAYDWDGEEISYRCVENKVDWTKGCGFEGKRSPFDGNSKMPWKVEWPCKWKAIGITVEGAGKDHMSEGGSHDFAKLMCERVLDYELPFPVFHEWFNAKGRSMSSSKGIGTSAIRFTEIVPPYLMRFLIARFKNTMAIDIDPDGMTIPDLFDGFDEAADKFWHQPEDDLSRVFELSRVDDTYNQQLFLPRFRDVAQYLQDPKVNLEDKFAEVKGSELTDSEKKVLKERVKYAKIWLADYAPDDFVFSISEEIGEEVDNLSDDQKVYLGKVLDLLNSGSSDPELLQQDLYNLSKEMGLGGKSAFRAIYMALLGKSHGPKAAWMIINNMEKVKVKLEKVLEKGVLRGR